MEAKGPDERFKSNNGDVNSSFVSVAKLGTTSQWSRDSINAAHM